MYDAEEINMGCRITKALFPEVIWYIIVCTGNASAARVAQPWISEIHNNNLNQH